MEKLILRRDLLELLTNALQEDRGNGDITTELTISHDSVCDAQITAKSEMVIAGIAVAEAVFYIQDPETVFTPHVKDGDFIGKGVTIASISGKGKSLLTAERVALNLFQRLSGIATLTHQFVMAIQDLPVKIVDTRKTTPLLRVFEKYAVRTGGAFNHRFGLYDGILIKDNHIAVAGGIKNAVKAAKKNAPHLMKVEVEVKDLEELKEALVCQADVVLLDNMTPEMVRQAVELTDKRALLEVSGGITLDNIRQYALAGVDLISIGALTHSAKAVDMSMGVVKCK
jgi:nicotinate-nucleotide pyrophosphorylase (carboxylating)